MFTLVKEKETHSREATAAKAFRCGFLWRIFTCENESGVITKSPIDNCNVNRQITHVFVIALLLETFEIHFCLVILSGTGEIYGGGFGGVGVGGIRSTA